MKNDQIRKDYVWNTLGSLLYAAASVVLAFFTMRTLGADEGGIFGFGFSTFGQQMFLIAYFGIRPFHITDMKPEYGFSVYESARRKTTAFAVIIAILWLTALFLTGTYTISKALCILLIAGWKITDGYADVYECECQRAGFLWRGGRELFFRTLAAMGVFLAVCALTKDLLVSALAALVVQIGAVAVFQKRLCGTVPEVFAEGTAAARVLSFTAAEKSLLSGTVLLFLGVFLDFAITGSPRYAIDLCLNDETSGIANILFMPANVIYLAANFVMKPLISRMAGHLEAGEQEEYGKEKKKLLLLIAALSALCLLGTVFLGKWALSVAETILGAAYTGKLTAHAGDLFLIILGGCLYAFASLYYYLLVIQRRQKAIFLCYLAVFVIAVGLAAFFVPKWGLAGAAVSYAASMSLVLCGFFLQERFSDNGNL